MQRARTGTEESSLELIPLRIRGQEAFILSLSLEPPAPPELTLAEADVFLLLHRQLSDAEIAKIRDTTIRTVRKQIHAIYEKLQVRSRNELMQHFTASDSRQAGPSVSSTAVDWRPPRRLQSG